MSNIDFADARWFAADLHVPNRQFGMLRIDDDVVDRSSFLDTRIEAPLAEAIQVDVAEAAAVAVPQAPVGWLFHTSFCASTLLARALHLAPYSVALKEPLVLRRLSDARHARHSIDGLVAPAVQLLARPWHPGGTVLIKPTHVALNIAAELLAAAPTSRAIILSSALSDFLISNLKKPPDSQAKIPVLAQRALDASGFGARLPAAAAHPPDLVCAAGLQWAAQRELAYQVVDAAGADRVRLLDMQPLLGDLTGTVLAAAHWLELGIPDPALSGHARDVGTRNAKATAVEYGPERRTQEAMVVFQQYRDVLIAARTWLETHVLPAMRADEPPGSPPATAAPRR